MTELYLIGKQASCLPIFWEAQAGDEEFSQVGNDGNIALHYTELPDNLSYFGLRCSRGAWGLVQKETKLGKHPPEAEIIPVDTMTGVSFYRRSVLLDSVTGKQQTTMSEVGVGPWRLQIILTPQFSVSVYCTNDEFI